LEGPPWKPVMKWVAYAAVWAGDSPGTSWMRPHLVCWAAARGGIEAEKGHKMDGILLAAELGYRPGGARAAQTKKTISQSAGKRVRAGTLAGGRSRGHV